MITSKAKTALTAYAKKIVALDLNSHDSFIIEEDTELLYTERKSLLKGVAKEREKLENALEKYFKTRMLEILSFTSEEYEYLKDKLSDIIHESENATYESIFYCVGGDEDRDERQYLEKGVWGAF